MTTACNTIKKYYPNMADTAISALTAAEKADIITAIESKAPKDAKHEAPPESLGELVAWFARLKGMGPPDGGARDYWPGVVRAASDAEEAVVEFFTAYRNMVKAGPVGKIERATVEKKSADFVDAACPPGYRLHFRGNAGWTVERTDDHVYLFQGVTSRAEALLTLDDHLNRLQR